MVCGWIEGSSLLSAVVVISSACKAATLPVLVCWMKAPCLCPHHTAHKQLVCDDEGPLYKSSRRVNFFFSLSSLSFPFLVALHVLVGRRWCPQVEKMEEDSTVPPSWHVYYRTRDSLTHHDTHTQEREKIERETLVENSITCPHFARFLFIRFVSLMIQVKYPTTEYHTD